MFSRKIFVILTLLLSLFAIAEEASAAEPTVLSANLKDWTVSTVAGLPDKGENVLQRRAPAPATATPATGRRRTASPT